MTVWEHCFWIEVERCKRAGLDKIEFAAVDKLAIELSKTLEYSPKPSEHNRSFDGG